MYNSILDDNNSNPFYLRENRNEIIKSLIIYQFLIIINYNILCLSRLYIIKCLIIIIYDLNYLIAKVDKFLTLDDK